jgi:hypothetical protein
MSFTKAKKTVSLSPSDPSSSSPSQSTTVSLSSSASLQNIKPYLNNQSIVSYGNKNLDDILHGGHLLGTVTLVASDSYTNYSDLLLYYEMNEAIVHQHKILLISPSIQEADDFIQSLPMNLNKNSQFQKNPTSEVKAKDEDGSENLSVEDKMKYLKNAWQYGKYIKGGTLEPLISLPLLSPPPPLDPPSTNSANSYCSSYDLSQRFPLLLHRFTVRLGYKKSSSKPITLEYFVLLLPKIMTSSIPKPVHSTALLPCPYPASSLFVASPPSLKPFLDSILTAVTSFQKVYATTNQPIRIFLHRFAGLTSRGFNLNAMESKRLLNQFALRLKHLISRPSPHLSVPQSTLTMTIQKDLQAEGFYRIIETVLADTHLALESFAGKAESVPIEYRFASSAWSTFFSLILASDTSADFSSFTKFSRYSHAPPPPPLLASSNLPLSWAPSSRSVPQLASTV